MHFLVENVDMMLNENKDCKFGHDTVRNKILNSNSMFLAEITEDEVLNVTNKLKGKFSMGYEE
jgi:phosphoribosylformylglycinamidine (FGAM) synthase-like amidotransferase family enzyme